MGMMKLQTLSISLLLFSFVQLCAHSESSAWTDVAWADLELMGDYEGAWVDAPEKSYQDINPHVCAQVINVDEGNYRIRIFQDFDRRADTYFDGPAKLIGEAIVVKSGGYDFKVTTKGLHGSLKLKNGSVKLNLKKVPRVSPTMGARPPKNAVVLFDGDNFDQWVHTDGRAVTWKLLGDGSMEIEPQKEHPDSEPQIGGTIETKRKFKSVRAHLEFRYPVEPGKSGQGRGNSGFFFQGAYECQILNSYGLGGMWNELGALYKLSPPQVNSARPPMEWQTYDVVYFAPEFEGGELKKPARITVRLNGTVVQRNVEIIHHTAHRQADRDNPAPKEAGSIILQDHSNRIQFRNIWVKEL